jgi:hypothetical protein
MLSSSRSACPVALIWRNFRRATAFSDRSPSSIVEVRVADAASLNAGQCSVAGKTVAVTTDPNSGGYSALIPVVFSERYDGPAVLRCEIDLREGLVGVCAVRANYAIIAERVASSFGRQQLDIFVPNVRDVAGILIRNSAITGRPSRANVVTVAAQPLTAVMLAAKQSLPLRHHRPSSTLTLPLRRCHYNLTDSRLGTYQISNETIDVTKLAAIIIDVWDEPADGRAFRNIAEKLAPALKILRSIGVSIIHAPHDHPIHPAVQPLADETIVPGDLTDPALIAKSFQAVGIEHLCYMGYVSNLCIMNRPIGFLEMRMRGFNTFLLRDASIAYETEESIEGEWYHKAMVHFFEINGGSTISLAELLSATEEMQSSSLKA